MSSIFDATAVANAKASMIVVGKIQHGRISLWVQVRLHTTVTIKNAWDHSKVPGGSSWSLLQL